jgi:hypothetical protein
MKILITAKDQATKVLKGVSKGLHRLRITAKKVGRSIKSSFTGLVKSIFSFKTALIGVAGAAGMGLLIKSSLSAIDKLGKVSSKLGVTSQELQKFRYAAKLAGIEETALDMGLQRFIRRVGEAAKGTGEAKDALLQMGIKLKDSNGNVRNATDLMGQVANAMRKTKDPAEQLRLAFKLFDSEGVAMVNMLKNGKGALNATMLEAEKLGFILDSNTVAAVQRANDAFFKMGQAIGGVWDKLVGALAPSLEKMGVWFTTFAATFSTTIQPLFGWLEHTLGNLGIRFGDATKAGKEWGTTVGFHIVETTKSIIDFFTKMKEGKTEATLFWESIKSGAQEALFIMQQIGVAIRAVINAYKRLKKEASNVTIPQAIAQATPFGGVATAISSLMRDKPSGGTQSGVGASGNTSNNVVNIYTATTAQGIDNALASRGDGGAKISRVGMNLPRSRAQAAYGNLSMGRNR